VSAFSRFGLFLLALLAGGLLFAQQDAAENNVAQQGEPAAGDAPELDFLFFKERVQPIFLEKRIGHARCVACHTHRIPPLVELSPGATTWDNEQSRKNFEIWKLFVVPGKPLESRALLHPLAKEAGGDAFHGGGKHWDSQGDAEWQTLASWVRGQRLGGLAIPPTSGVVRVLQTNSAGDNIHVIDPATNTVVGLIEEIEAPHGIAIAPDGMRIYVTNESLVTLDVVDVKTLKVFKRIRLSGRPNNLDVAKDGSRVYVGIREDPGAVDVIDTASLTNVKTIPVEGPIHNVYLSPEGSLLFAGSIQSKILNVVDLAREAISWTLTMDGGIRPMALMESGEGSTARIIVQLSDFHGFAVVDFATRKEVERVEFPDPPGVEKELEGLQGSPAHGLAFSPDQSVLWSTSKYYHAVYAYGAPQPCRPGRPAPPGRRCEWELLKVVDVGSHPDWLAMTPDGKQLYVALAGDDETAVIDTETMTVVDRIAVGAVPKRVVAGVLATR
jgi:YVTN family beta-propeller protein